MDSARHAPLLLVKGVGSGKKDSRKSDSARQTTKNKTLLKLEEELHDPLLEPSLNDQDDIEDIELAPIDMLHCALESANPLMYHQALTINAEKRNLEKRAEQLKHRLDIEIRIKARRQKHKYFGWKGLSWLQQPNSSEVDLDELWRMLRSSSAHEFNLEDPYVSQLFFNNLRELMTGQDMDLLQAQWGPHFGNQLDAYFHSYPAVSLFFNFYKESIDFF